MTDECQKRHVIRNGINWGEGKCLTMQTMKAMKAMETMKTMKAIDLRVGMEYKLPGQRKWRKITYAKELVKYDHIPPIGRKVVIVFDGCKQVSLLKDTEVVVKELQEVRV
jgi:hypothetical protein